MIATNGRRPRNADGPSTGISKTKSKKEEASINCSGLLFLMADDIFGFIHVF